MNKKDEKALAEMIRKIGKVTRDGCNLFPEGEDRDIAWACIAAAIVGAGLHDMGDKRKMLEILESTVVGMTGALLIEKFQKNLESN
jgi:hypothetical protein